MTVGELIELLRTLPPGAEVQTAYDYFAVKAELEPQHIVDHRRPAIVYIVSGMNREEIEYCIREHADLAGAEMAG